jgi:hypothetical protein
MFVLEKSKFTAPKYSTCFHDLIEFLNIPINDESLSSTSSIISRALTPSDQHLADHELPKPGDLLNPNIMPAFLEFPTKLNALKPLVLPPNKKLSATAFEAEEESVGNRTCGRERPMSSGRVEPASLSVSNSREKVLLRQFKEIKEQRGGSLRTPMAGTLDKNSEPANPPGPHQMDRPESRKVKVFRRQNFFRQEMCV